jgi:hypothetical protein
VNRDYEGEIRQAGDTVKIQGIGDPTVSNYTRNTAIAAPEVLSDNTRSLVIDQAKYVNFMVDDLDRIQAASNVLDRATSRVAYKFRDAADTFIGGKYVDAGSSTGTDATPIQFTASNAYATIVGVSVALSNLNVEKANRYIVLPPWAIGIIAQAPEFVQYGQYANPSIVREGFFGRFAGFDVYESPNLTTVVNGSSQTVYQVIAGLPDAITYAEQIPIGNLEAYRHPSYFADAVRGLFVYGAKTVLANALHNLKIRQ